MARALQLHALLECVSFCLPQENAVFFLFLPNNVMRGFKHLVFLLGSDEGCLS